MLKRALLGFVVLAACGGKHRAPNAAVASEGCPAAVPAAVTRAYPGATQGPCSGEHEDGMDLYEVTITRADGTTAELELSADGAILATEEAVAVMPDPVAKAFAAKYPGAAATKIERITSPGKPAVFEIAFAGKQATFSETGDFVEEEHAEGDETTDRD